MPAPVVPVAPGGIRSTCRRRPGTLVSNRTADPIPHPVATSPSAFAADPVADAQRVNKPRLLALALVGPGAASVTNLR
jgi:hypothetical protein